MWNWKQQMPSTQMEHPQQPSKFSLFYIISAWQTHTHRHLHVFLHYPAAKQKYILKCTTRLFFPAGRRQTFWCSLATHSPSSMSHRKPDSHFNHSTHWPEVSTDYFWHSLYFQNLHTHIYTALGWHTQHATHRLWISKGQDGHYGSNTSPMRLPISHTHTHRLVKVQKRLWISL